MLKSLSVFFPAYNEEVNIERVVKEVLIVLPKIAQEFEVIVVDDGSKDGTAEIVNRLTRTYPQVRLVSHGVNKGYGAALVTGFKESRMEWVFFTDADRQFDIQELKKLLPYCNGYNAVFGYRAKRADPVHRCLLASLWRIIVCIVLGIRVKDVDCAFKLIRKDMLNNLTLSCRGAAISAELLVKLKARGCRWIEIPVSHFPRKKGKQTGSRPDVLLKAVWELYLLKKHVVLSAVSRLKSENSGV